MSKVLKETLKMDLPALAEMLRSKGRGRDSVLAHITPREAALLKRKGGSGTINPDTGLPEFDDGFDLGSYFGGDTGGAFTPTTQDASFQVPTDTSQYTPVTPTSTPEQAQAATQADFAGSPAPAPAAPDVAPPPAAALESTPSTGYGLGTGAGYNLTTGAPYQNLLGAGAQTPLQTPAGLVGATPDITGATGALTPEQQAAYGVGTTTQDTTKTDKKDSTSDWAKLAAALGLTGSQLANMAARGAVGTGLVAQNAAQSQKAAQQVQAATQQQQDIATPYQQQGQQLIKQAQAGQLTPASQQAYAAAKAQLNQSIANRGGVGAMQAANQEAAIYQNLLNNQYTYGLNVMQIGDNISLGAIKTGLQLDTQLNQATTNFYTNLAQFLAGGGSGGGRTITIN